MIPVGVRAYLALGSNLGDRRDYLSRAVSAIDHLLGTRILARTPIEETAPLGDKDQPLYLNQMVLIETTLGPYELLDACHEIEAASGRLRGEHWGSRTLDVDIVRYGDLQLADPKLTLPHPGLADRDFWLRELAALEPYDR